MKAGEGAEHKRKRYSFIARPFVEVSAKDGETCSFCRASLGNHGVYSSQAVPVDFLREKLLCRSCSEAWGEQAGFDAGAIPREAPV